MSDTADRIETTKNELMAEKGLTLLEFQFIHDLSCSDFAFEAGRQDGLRGYVNSMEGFNMKRVRGIMSSLIQKGFLNVANYNDEMNDPEYDHTWACVTDQDITDAIYYMWYPEVA